MSLQYDEYLKEHIQNVNHGLQWMTDNLDKSKLGLLERDFSEAIENTGEHDASKFDLYEYNSYDNYFYGGNRSYAVKQAFDYAWLQHQHKNPHHWQYWVLINDDDGMNRALPMPEVFVLEMIADWWSFSWKSGNLTEIFEWYDSHKDKMILYPKTKKLVEDILDAMKEVLGYEEHLEHHDEDK